MLGQGQISFGQQTVESGRFVLGLRAFLVLYVIQTLFNMIYFPKGE